MNAMTRTQNMLIGSIVSNVRILHAERTHVRKQVRDLKREGYWRVIHTVRCPWNGTPLSIDEGCRMLRNALALERSKIGHFSYDAGRFVATRQRYVIARFFRRYGRILWTRP